MHPKKPSLPPKLKSITKGHSLKSLLDDRSVDFLASNIEIVLPSFNTKEFKKEAKIGLPKYEILQRGQFLGELLYKYLPKPYEKGLGYLLQSLTPPLTETKGGGLAVFFYLPHTCFVRSYGIKPEFNNNKDPFAASMLAQYELTRRFTAEYSIRAFIQHDSERVLSYLKKWIRDPCPHVRRLCSEGTRPKLPWAVRLPEFIEDPKRCLFILEKLKDDEDLYVRRSVANHVGDIAKDHRDLAIDLCRSWLKGADENRKWVIRHALRYPDKKGDLTARKLRELAGKSVKSD